MYNKIIEDMTKAMKEKEKNRLTVIRGIKAAVDKEHIDKKLEITDELVIDVISHQVKLLKDSILEFEKGKREDLIEKAEKEMSILKEYLPTELSKEEVIKIIEDSFSKINPTSMKEMGKVMKEAKEQIGAAADGKIINEVVKELLG